MSAGPIYELHVPGEATRREYTVYLLVARQRDTGRITAVYIGKTGDNREGCNPLISRAGNHMSYNKLHSQARNRLGTTEEFDFHFFYAFFGRYIAPEDSREGIDLINEMERQLNKRAQTAFGALVVNPYMGSARVPLTERQKRAGMCTPDRMDRLDALIATAERFVANGTSSGATPSSSSSSGVHRPD